MKFIVLLFFSACCFGAVTDRTPLVLNASNQPSPLDTSLYTLRLYDGNVRIADNTDSTKDINFSVGDQSTGAKLTLNTGAQTVSRILSVPVLGGSDTLATLATAQTFSAAQIFGSTIGVTGIASFADGSAAAPSIAFTSDPGNGLYLSTTDTVGVTTNGSLKLSVNTTDVTSTLPFYAAAGSFGAPSYAFSGDTNTGFYSAGADQIGIAIGGAARETRTTSSVSSTLRYIITAGTEANPAYTFSGATGHGMWSNGASSLAFSVAGTKRIDIDATRLNLVDALQLVPSASTGTINSALFIGPANHTALTASTEYRSYRFDGASQQFATGALTTQRFATFGAPTFAFVGASTITNAATLAVEAAPIAGTNATITNAYSLWVQAGTTALGGRLLVNGAVGGTAAVDVAIGANDGMRITDGTRNVYLGTTGGEAAVGTLTAHDMKVISNGAVIGSFNATAITSTVPYYAPDGAVGTPSVTFTSDTDTGLYRFGSGVVGFTSNGVLNAKIGNGVLTVGDGTTAQENDILIAGPAAQNRVLGWRTGALNRWTLNANNTAEAGANAGSDLILTAWDDAGAAIDAPFTISRVANGAIAFTRPITSASASGIVSNGLTLGQTASVAGSAFISATGGLSLRAQTGSSFDFKLVNPGNTVNIISVATGTNDITTGGSVAIGTAGAGLLIKEGSNATLGTATLVAGTVTVNTTKVTANSRIFLQAQDGASGPHALHITARTAGTSFVITSSSAGDTSSIAWMIVEPAP